MSSVFPQSFSSEEQLDTLLSVPREAAVAALEAERGDIALLGAGGKMGLSLARMMRRAADEVGSKRRVIAVSRFSDPDRQQALERAGVETVRGDLLDEALYARLPDVAVVYAMTGYKFGTAGRPDLTWATNTLMPAWICRRFQGAKLVAFSTGNVYPLVPVSSEGSSETDALLPVGEYALTALGRERVYEYFSHRDQLPLALLRLNYAVEMRYGVLVDIGLAVWEERPVSLSMGHVNVIWQGDACSMAIAALDHVAAPPFVVNLAGPEKLEVATVAEAFAARFGKSVRFTGTPEPCALLSNGRKGYELLEHPQVRAEQLIAAIADWIAKGGRLLGKATHFEVTDGGF